jgi:hypothetical protein
MTLESFEGYCQVNRRKMKCDYSSCIIRRCTPPTLYTIVIASLLRLSAIAFGCIFASP